MIIKSVKGLQLPENHHGVDVRRMYNHDNTQAMHITLYPGQSLKPHITPVNVFFYYLKVLLLFRWATKLYCWKDNLVESPKNIVHCFFNGSDSEYKYKNL
jgi:hypothetical protein